MAFHETLSGRGISGGDFWCYKYFEVVNLQDFQPKLGEGGAWHACSGVGRFFGVLRTCIAWMADQTFKVCTS